VPPGVRPAEITAGRRRSERSCHTCLCCGKVAARQAARHYGAAAHSRHDSLSQDSEDVRWLLLRRCSSRGWRCRHEHCQSQWQPGADAWRHHHYARPGPHTRWHSVTSRRYIRRAEAQRPLAGCSRAITRYAVIAPPWWGQLLQSVGGHAPCSQPKVGALACMGADFGVTVTHDFIQRAAQVAFLISGSAATAALSRFSAATAALRKF
jgi:hypothetical protein